ncbi:MAG: sulfotransferase, partial [Anaerolineales bacterium]
MNPQTTPADESHPPVSYKLVFIVGFPRSGTTWTMWLLGQHPAIIVCQQAGFFHALQPIYRWWQDAGGMGKSVHNFSALRIDKTPAGTGQSSKLSSLLSLEDFYAPAHALGRNVFDQIASYGPGVQVVVEQTPENLALIDLILDIFPDAYILHVIRDPRSAYASMRKAVFSWADPGGFPSNPVEVARIWGSFIEHGKRASQATNRYREVHYETLLKNGPSELEQIYSWLDLPADHAFCQKAVEESRIGKMQKQKGLGKKGFFRKGIAEGWRDELSSSEIRVIEYIAGDLMEQLGYTRAFDPTSRKPFRLW